MGEGSRTRRCLFKIVLRTLCYAALAAGGFLFSKDAFDLYQDGTTAFEVTQHTVTVEDFPVATLCYSGHQKTPVMDQCDQPLNGTVSYALWFGSGASGHAINFWTDQWVHDSEFR